MRETGLTGISCWRAGSRDLECRNRPANAHGLHGARERHRHIQ